MPKKLINTLKYGNGKTKRKIYLMMGILAAGVVLTLLAVFLGNALMGLAAFLVMFIDGLILFNTSFEQKTVSVDHQEKTKKNKKTGKGKRKRTEEEPGALEWLESEKKESPEKEEKEISLAQYDEQKLKKLFVAYKVKKHHVPVLIDLCSAEKIVQRPAYMWNDASYLYFLVLDDEPRLLKSRLSDSDTVHIRRGMTARPVEEYPELNDKSVVSMIFGGLLPKYYTVESSPYRTEHRKNMYSAAPGIWCSSGSVKNMLKLLPEKFVLDDGKTDGESIYYQEIYVARVMFYDGIYSAQEYKDKVLEVLGELIRAEIADSVVTEYLNSMLQKGLIPREYADYVISKRKAK
ncbi:MAG: hypothetical protein IJ420_02055 [Lachnospiraceae bacterium]|nr:hypothetical protein [Lachnospiraceae bacterium]MBQ8632370.1 hypothetical protein [Lachnospiraceae bacterium]